MKKLIALVALIPTLTLASPKDPWPVEEMAAMQIICMERALAHNYSPEAAVKYCDCFYAELSGRVGWTDFVATMQGDDIDAAMKLAEPSRLLCRPILNKLSSHPEPSEI